MSDAKKTLEELAVQRTAAEAYFAGHDPALIQNIYREFKVIKHAFSPDVFDHWSQITNPATGEMACNEMGPSFICNLCGDSCTEAARLLGTPRERVRSLPVWKTIARRLEEGGAAGDPFPGVIEYPDEFRVHPLLAVAASHHFWQNRDRFISRRFIKSLYPVCSVPFDPMSDIGSPLVLLLMLEPERWRRDVGGIVAGAGVDHMLRIAAGLAVLGRVGPKHPVTEPWDAIAAIFSSPAAGKARYDEASSSRDKESFCNDMALHYLLSTRHRSADGAGAERHLLMEIPGPQGVPFRLLDAVGKIFHDLTLTAYIPREIGRVMTGALRHIPGEFLAEPLRIRSSLKTCRGREVTLLDLVLRYLSHLDLIDRKGGGKGKWTPRVPDTLNIVSKMSARGDLENMFRDNGVRRIFEETLLGHPSRRTFRTLARIFPRYVDSVLTSEAACGLEADMRGYD